MKPASLFAHLAFFAFTACAAAQPVAPSHARLTVEQTLYAGLPVWLDVEADDPCIAPHYTGSLYGRATGGNAEIVDAAGRVVARAVPLFNYLQLSQLVQAGGCPNPDPFDAERYPGHGLFPNVRHPRAEVSGLPQPSATAGGPTRIPLHLVADLRRPGQYAVRWVIPATDKLGHLNPTPWVGFVLKPTSARQREAWLNALLAQAPGDEDEIERSYVPSLLAAWDDPRVGRKLVDLLCSQDDRLSTALMPTLGSPLSEEKSVYLTQAIAGGCLSAGLMDYVNLAPTALAVGGKMSEMERRKLLVAIAGAVPRASGKRLANALHMLAALKGRRRDGYSEIADQAVLQVVPRILADAEPDGGTNNDPKWILVDYARAFDRDTDRRAVLRALAGQQDRAAGYATTLLIDTGNSEDVPFLRDRLTGPVDELNLGRVDFAFKTILRQLGPDGFSLLQSLTHAENPEISAAAEVALADGGDHAAIGWIIAVLQGDDEAAKTVLALKLIGSGGCAGASCGWSSGGDADAVARQNAPTEARLIAYFEAKLAMAH